MAINNLTQFVSSMITNTTNNIQIHQEEQKRVRQRRRYNNNNNNNPNYNIIITMVTTMETIIIIIIIITTIFIMKKMKNIIYTQVIYIFLNLLCIKKVKNNLKLKSKSQLVVAEVIQSYSKT